ncbi:MAG: hypothetical protein LW823_08290 [Rickettsiales bacterium]|jgi:hypothetical protein|nr:hypothetical protein [Rickettsiales bacterium]
MALVFDKEKHDTLLQQAALKVPGHVIVPEELERLLKVFLEVSTFNQQPLPENLSFSAREHIIRGQKDAASYARMAVNHYISLESPGLKPLADSYMSSVVSARDVT